MSIEIHLKTGRCWGLLRVWVRSRSRPFFFGMYDRLTPDSMVTSSLVANRWRSWFTSGRHAHNSDDVGNNSANSNSSNGSSNSGCRKRSSQQQQQQQQQLLEWAGQFWTGKIRVSCWFFVIFFFFLPPDRRAERERARGSDVCAFFLTLTCCTSAWSRPLLTRLFFCLFVCFVPRPS